MDWVGKNLDAINFEEGLQKLSQGLQKFDKVSTNLPITDLYQYKNVGQLLSALSEYESRQRREVKKVEGGNVVYDDGRFFVVNPFLKYLGQCYKRFQSCNFRHLVRVYKLSLVNNLFIIFK